MSSTAAKLADSLDTPVARRARAAAISDIKDSAGEIEDVQATPDARELDIERVGIRGVRHPLAVRCADGSTQHTVTTAAMYVRLPRQYKGTHMSRFIDLLGAQTDPLDAEQMSTMMASMLDRLEAEAGVIELRFPFFVSKRAPISGVPSMMDYEVCLSADKKPDEATVVTTEVLVPATTLCPCSKKISDYGAHNQRSHITLKVETNSPVSVEELIRVAEEEASCEVFGLLKRADEKFVTERAYDNPKFVEDLVRDLAGRLVSDARVDVFSVQAENFESIHNHSAYACIEQDKRLPT